MQHLLMEPFHVLVILDLLVPNAIVVLQVFSITLLALYV